MEPSGGQPSLGGGGQIQLIAEHYHISIVNVLRCADQTKTILGSGIGITDILTTMADIIQRTAIDRRTISNTTNTEEINPTMPLDVAEIEIFNKLDPGTFVKLCQLNKAFMARCKTEKYWMNYLVGKSISDWVAVLKYIALLGDGEFTRNMLGKLMVNEVVPYDWSSGVMYITPKIFIRAIRIPSVSIKPGQIEDNWMHYQVEPAIKNILMKTIADTCPIPTGNIYVNQAKEYAPRASYKLVNKNALATLKTMIDFGGEYSANSCETILIKSIMGRILSKYKNIKAIPGYNQTATHQPYTSHRHTGVMAGFQGVFDVVRDRTYNDVDPKGKREIYHGAETARRMGTFIGSVIGEYYTFTKDTPQKIHTVLMDIIAALFRSYDDVVIYYFRGIMDGAKSHPDGGITLLGVVLKTYTNKKICASMNKMESIYSDKVCDSIVKMCRDTLKELKI